MGRPGLEPGTQCLKDRGGRVQHVQLIHTARFAEGFGPAASSKFTMYWQCYGVRSTSGLLQLRFTTAVWRHISARARHFFVKALKKCTRGHEPDRFVHPKAQKVHISSHAPRPPPANATSNTMLSSGTGQTVTVLSADEITAPDEQSYQACIVVGEAILISDPGQFKFLEELGEQGSRTDQRIFGQNEAP
jgi:hypothetical protein